MKKIDFIKSYYEPNIGKGLPDYSVLGWESEEAQKARFEVLIRCTELQGKKILDVGCGMGNLYEYLLLKNIKANYTGIDILQSMIDNALRKKLDADFLCIDIFEHNPFEAESFEVVYSSGIFNLNMGNNNEFLIKAAGLFIYLAKEIVVFNLLHYLSPGREDKYFYFKPHEVKKQILEYYGEKFKKICIIEGYLKNDFSVVIYR